MQKISSSVEKANNLFSYLIWDLRPPVAQSPSSSSRGSKKRCWGGGWLVGGCHWSHWNGNLWLIVAIPTKGSACAWAATEILKFCKTNFIHCLSLTSILVPACISTPIEHKKKNLLKLFFVATGKILGSVQEVNDLNLACFCNPNWWIFHPCKSCRKVVWLPPSFDTLLNYLHHREILEY